MGITGTQGNCRNPGNHWNPGKHRNHGNYRNPGNCRNHGNYPSEGNTESIICMLFCGSLHEESTNFYVDDPFSHLRSHIIHDYFRDRKVHGDGEKKRMGLIVKNKKAGPGGRRTA